MTIKSITMHGPHNESMTMVITRSTNGAYGAGRSGSRGGDPISGMREETLLGIVPSRWVQSMTLDEASCLIAEAKANLAAKGFQEVMKVLLKSGPDNGAGAHGLFSRSPETNCSVRSYAEASQKCIEYIRKYNLDATQWAGGVIHQGDDRVGCVTYDGTVMGNDGNEIALPPILAASKAKTSLSMGGLS